MNILRKLFKKGSTENENGENQERLPGIFTVMKIGYTLDGEFDPKHDDFMFCCNKLHIHKMIILIVIVSTLIAIYQIVEFIINPSSNSLIILRRCLTFFSVAVLILGIIFWKKFNFFLKIYLFYLAVSILIDFGYIVYLLVVVIKYSQIKNENSPTTVDILHEQLSMLIEVVYVTLTLFFDIWQFYCLYVEYKYLKGKLKTQS